MTAPAPTDDDLVPVLQAVQRGDDADLLLDNEGIALALGLSLDEVARRLGVAKARSLIWGFRAGRTPAPWFTDLELTVQGRRVVVASIMDLTERKEAQARIERLAYFDALTGLPNRSSFENRLAEMLAEPGKLLLRADMPLDVQFRLQGMGYSIVNEGKTSGPINGIFNDQQHGTLMGGSSDYGDDYGIAW